MRTNLQDAKNSRIPAVLNTSPADTRFVQYLNEACERLVKTGENFHGLIGRYQFCLTNGCITLPRQIASVETVAVCDRPIPIYNTWFQFLEAGPGLQSDGGSCDTNSGCGCGGLSWQDKRGEFCAFEDILGTNKKIRVYADVAETAGTTILLLGYDENGNWIRTESSPGVWQDGEYVSIVGGPNMSTKFFGSLTGVQKPVSKGTIRLYEYDTTLTTQRAIAVYEPDETRPSYRRALIVGLSHIEGACETKQVTVMARHEFIPVVNDTDWLLIGNLPALKLECQAIIKEENNLPTEALFYHNLALQQLRSEVRHYVGHGIINPIRMMPRNIGGPGVRNLV